MLKNSATSYGILAKSFHWIIALLILGLLSVGFYMTAMAFSPFKLQLYGLHKSFGIIVLSLAILRVLWRFSNKQPAHLATHAPWERALAKASHFLLYVLIIAMPLSGWLMSSAGDFPNQFFGLFEMPDLVPKDKALFDLTRQAHTAMAFGILAILALHMAGAFKHHLIDRDETLQRMSFARLGVFGGLVLGTVLGIFWVAPLVIKFYEPPAAPMISAQKEPLALEQDIADIEEKMIEAALPFDAPRWVISPEASAIQFEATQYGEAFSGQFKNFTGEIYFDPKNLEASRADIEIDIASIETGSDDRDGQARSSDWFNASEFPSAQFVTKSFTHLEANRYEAEADLTIRETTLPVVLPFSLEISENSDGKKIALMAAEISLNRLEFGVGQGQWSSTEAIGDKVSVTIKLEATTDGAAP